MALQRILETVLYFDSASRDATVRFYADVLGLRPLAGDQEAFRLGEGLLLLFDHERSSIKERPPPHGAPSRAHIAFLVAPEEYGDWKMKLQEVGVEILDEIEWPSGPHSFYFHDPAGNVLEIADGDMWPSAD